MKPLRNSVATEEKSPLENIYPNLLATIKMDSTNKLCFRSQKHDRVQEALERQNILIQLFHAVQNGLLECLKLVTMETWFFFIDTRHPNTTFTLLHEAAISKRPDILEFILSKKPNINIKSFKGSSALHLAVKSGNVECVKILCEHRGLDKDCQDRKGQTPLDIACRLNFIEIVKVLLNHGANPLKAEFDGMTCLHHPMRTNQLELIELLLNSKCLPETKNNNGLSPIALAINFGYMEAFSLCIRSVKDGNRNVSSILNTQDSEGYSCILNAVRHMRLEIFKECLNLGADVKIKQNEGRNLLHIASEIGWLDVISIILDCGINIDSVDRNMDTSLHLAIRNGHLQIIEYLLERGAQTNTCNNLLLTPLLMSVTVMSTLGSEKFLTIMKLLLDHKADVNIKNKKKENILHLLVGHNQFIAIEYLFQLISAEERFGLINSSNENGNFPLHIACALNFKDISVLLVNEGANLVIGNHNESIPIHEATRNGHLDIVKFLIEINKDQINVRNENEETLILIAVLSDQYYIFQFLFNKNVDLNSKDEVGNNILMYACQIGNIKMVDLILHKDFNIHMKNYHQSTPLHLAAAAGQKEMVEYLLTLGAEMHENIYHQTALTMALENEHFETARTFLNDKNWKKTMEFRFKTGKNHLESIMLKSEDVAYELLDRGVKVVLDSSMNSAEVIFDLSMLDKGPYDSSNVNGRYNDLLTIAKHRKVKLLSHPLAEMLLNRKWVMFGYYTGIIDFVVYIIFLLLFTYIIMERIPQLDSYGCSTKNFTKSGFPPLTKTDLIWNLLFGGVLWIRISLEIFKLYSQKFRYFIRWENLFFIYLYIFGPIFMYNRNNYLCSYQLVSGILAAVYAWTIPMYYTQNLPILGIPILMFKSVTLTVAKVLIIFINVMIGFTIAFYIINQRQTPFQNIFYSYVKVFDMLTGELDYVTFFVDSDFSILSTVKLILIPLFIIVVPISLINLMVGMAVGDIDRMMDEASVTMKIQQITFLSEIEATFPKRLQEKFYESIYIKKLTGEEKTLKHYIIGSPVLATKKKSEL